MSLILANSLTVQGTIIMVTSITLVTSLMLYCVYRVVTSQGNEK
jgi:hypothetical protein